MRLRAWPVALFAVVLPSALFAVGGTITSGDASFTRTGFGGTPNADFKGVSATLAQDQLFQMGWWYRFPDFETQETPFPDPIPDSDSEEYLGNHSIIIWNNLGGLGLVRASEGVTVADDGSAPQSGFVVIHMTLLNLTADPVGIELFHYLDLDLAATSTGDSAAFVGKTPNEILDLADTGGSFGQYQVLVTPFLAPSHVRHQVAAYPGIKLLLNDSSATDLDNSGLPFGSGDFSGAFQLSISLPAHATATYTFYVNIGRRTYCRNFYNGIYCDGFETTDRSLWGP